MIVARIIEPSSKLAIVRSLDKQTATSTLGELLEVEGADTKELYEAMDWLLGRQSLIEQKLEATVLTYKSLSVVERAFRSFKLVDLQVRPIYHRLAEVNITCIQPRPISLAILADLTSA
jgi:transposase